MNAGDFGYFAKDVAKDIGVTTSTLRRWSIELEKQGYHFERNNKGQRIYNERDFSAFRELKKLIGNHVSFSDAIKVVSSTDKPVHYEAKTPSVHEDEVRLSKRELEEIVSQSVKKAVEEDREVMFQVFKKKLNQAIERQESFYMDEIKRIQEENKALIEESTKEKKSLWKRIFNVK